MVQQKKWCSPEGAQEFERQDLYVGFAIWPVYREAPQGPYDADRIRRIIDRIEATGVEGVVIFCSGDLDRYGVRETVRKALDAKG
jgi:hypothetical protein